MSIPVYPFRVLVRVTSKWKQLVKQPNGTVLPHNGMDFGTVDLRKTGKKENADVLAMYDWECTAVTNLGTLGWACKLYYKEIGETWYYVHLKEITIKKGQKGKAGDVIAHVGVAKGQTMSEHTHIQDRKGRETGDVYVIRMDGNSINPNVQLVKSKLLGEINKPKPPVIVTPPVVVTPPPVIEVPVDYKVLYEKAVTDHAQYVSDKTKEIDDINVELSKYMVTLGDAMEAVRYTGDKENFSYFLQQIQYNLEEAQKYDYRKLLSKIANTVTQYINKLIGRGNGPK